MKKIAARRGPLAGRVALRLWAFAFAGLVAVGCSDVKESLEDADKSLSDALLGTETEEAGSLTGPALTDSLYEGGLKLKAEGQDAEAFARFEQAAERGHAGAAYELGEAYEAGRGVDRDAKAGAEWIDAAAARGEPRAQHALGAALYNGDGVARDYVRAVEYLGQAAEQGHADAQFLLGESYANGRGVTKNLSWAARWYGKAAEQGHADGAFSFGVVQAAGLGLPTNLPWGYAWLDVASDRGHVKAGEVRAAVANKMTPAEIATGRQRAQAFAPEAATEFADRPTVMYVQHSLNQLGFNAGTVDGLMGPRTRSAIKAYLSSNGDTDGQAAVTPALVQRLFEGQQSAA